MHRIGRDQALVGVSGEWLRGAEHSHHRIADELHDRPLRGQDGIAHRDAMFLQLTRQPARVRTFRNRRIAADVRDQDGYHKAFDATETLTTPAHTGRDAAGEQAAEPLALLLAIDDGLVQASQVAKARLATAGRLLGKLQEELLD